MATKKRSLTKSNKHKQAKPDEYINPFLISTPAKQSNTSFNLDEFLSQGIFNNKK